MGHGRARHAVADRGALVGPPRRPLRRRPPRRADARPGRAVARPRDPPFSRRRDPAARAPDVARPT
jgi:hypothetical protein